MKGELYFNGFTGLIEFSITDNCFFRKILDIDDLVTYEAETKEKLKQEFKKAVKDYINDLHK